MQQSSVLLSAENRCSYCLCADLGQAKDGTGLLVLKRSQDIDENGQVTPVSISVVDAFRYPLGTAYTLIADTIAEMLAADPFRELKNGDGYVYRKKAVVVVDKTGVGRAVLDILHAKGVRPVGITATGGNQANAESYDSFNVPVKDLWAGMQIYFQNKQIIIPENLELRDALFQISKVFATPLAKVAA